jgi:hypothetical protein
MCGDDARLKNTCLLKKIKEGGEILIGFMEIA